MTKLDLTNFLNQTCIYIIYDLLYVYLRCKKWHHDVIQLNTCENKFCIIITFKL